MGGHSFRCPLVSKNVKKASLAHSEFPDVRSVSSLKSHTSGGKYWWGKRAMTWLNSQRPRLRLSPNRSTVHWQFYQTGTRAVALSCSGKSLTCRLRPCSMNPHLPRSVSPSPVYQSQHGRIGYRKPRQGFDEISTAGNITACIRQENTRL